MHKPECKFTVMLMLLLVLPFGVPNTVEPGKAYWNDRQARFTELMNAIIDCFDRGYVVEEMKVFENRPNPSQPGYFYFMCSDNREHIIYYSDTKDITLMGGYGVYPDDDTPGRGVIKYDFRFRVKNTVQFYLYPVVLLGNSFGMDRMDCAMYMGFYTKKIYVFCSWFNQYKKLKAF